MLRLATGAVRFTKIGCVIFTALGAIVWVDFVRDPGVGYLWKGGPASPLSATVLWIFPLAAAIGAHQLEAYLRDR